MNKLEYVSRRNFLGGAGLTVMSLLVGSPRVSAHAQGGDAFESDLDIELRARSQSLALRSESATTAWFYQAKVLKGDPASKSVHPDSTLGPSLRYAKWIRC